MPPRWPARHRSVRWDVPKDVLKDVLRLVSKDIAKDDPEDVPGGRCDGRPDGRSERPRPGPTVPTVRGGTMHRLHRSATLTLLLLLAVTFGPLLCRIGGDQAWLAGRAAAAAELWQTGPTGPAAQPGAPPADTAPIAV